MSANVDLLDIPDSIPFLLSPRLDEVRLATEFREKRRLRVADVLNPAGALELYRHLHEVVKWKTYLVANGRLFCADPVRTDLSCDEAEARMRELAHSEMRSGSFSSICDLNRILDDEAPAGYEDEAPAIVDSDPLTRLWECFNSRRFLSFIRNITAIPEINRVDFHLMRHRPGHFLAYQAVPPVTAGWCGNPRAGFIFNLTPEWMVEWGGLLEFHANNGALVEAYMPSFNALDIFTYPQGHWISAVAPFAAGQRLTIAGRLYVANEGDEDVQN